MKTYEYRDMDHWVEANPRAAGELVVGLLRESAGGLTEKELEDATYERWIGWVLAEMEEDGYVKSTPEGSFHLTRAGKEASGG